MNRRLNSAAVYMVGKAGVGGHDGVYAFLALVFPLCYLLFTKANKT